MPSKMAFLKRNYGWLIVVIFATLPLFTLLKMATENGEVNLEMMYHISGEFAVRWMTAVLTLTPFFILFGITNLSVRQAMGIATAVWSFLHFIIFIWGEGFLETFTQVNYILGFVAVLILVPLFFTSNRKSIKWLKSKWKKLQRFAYAAIILSLLHVAILEKTWVIYAVIVGVGFIIRIPPVKQRLIALRKHRSARSQNQALV